METVNGLQTLEVDGADLAALIISNEFEDFEKHDRASLEKDEIAYMYRDGAKDDVARLECMLQQDLQCDNISKAYNCTAPQLKVKLSEFEVCEAAQRAKCLLIFAASHGNRDVFFTNTTVADARSKKGGGAIPLYEIWNPIVNAFGGRKPIIFFFQCCRGSDWDTGRSVRIQHPLDSPQPTKGLFSTSDPDAEIVNSGDSIDVSMPNHADVVLAFATVEDHASYRYAPRSCPEDPSVKKGSYFLTALCEAVRQREETQDDLIRLLTRVNRRVASEDLCIYKKLQPYGPEEKIKVKQCVCVQSALTMKIHFKKNPT